MIRWSWLLSVLFVGLAGGQTASAPSSPAAAPQTSQEANKGASDQDDHQPPQPPAPEVPMGATVLTIKGFCPEQKPAPDFPCQTAITRAQFEGIAAAIQPAMNATVKRQLASLYPRLLVMSHEAEAQGLDKQPQYQQMMAYTRMQILTQALTRKLQEESAQISEREITNYYQKNLEAFQLYTLQRLFVPLRRQSPVDERDRKGAQTVQPVETPKEKSARQAADAEEMTKLAERLRARAAAGEDFVKLQKEAFNVAGVKVESPNTSIGKVRRTSIAATQADALQLNVGEVSQLISDAGGLSIYKMEAKEQLTLDQVREEVRGVLSSERLKDVVDKIQNSYTSETNDAYFAPAARPPQGPEGVVSPSKKP
jgi:hypothetical protein